MATEKEKDILIIEPFNGGSHGQLIKLILSDIDIGPKCVVMSLPAKKWHWRARTSALYFSQIIPFSSYRVIFTSSVLNLAELIALRPDLGQLKKIVYFHENQLVYPVRKVKERDFQYGYNQILTSLVADVVVFNSAFNMESFLSSISSHLKLIPDHRPKNLEAIVRPKCRVLYFPVNIRQATDGDGNFISTSDVHHCHQNNGQISVENTISCVDAMFTTHAHESDKELEHCITDNSGLLCKPESSKEVESGSTSHRSCGIETCTEQFESDIHPVANIGIIEPFKESETCLHIVWPHRWEHDKDPDSFFQALLQLQSEGYKFHVSVIGETFTDVPDIFDLVKPQLADKIVNWGYQTQHDYINILNSAHVVVSTALHEFFGVSMLEATGHGCYPLCPKRLVYPEIYPEECLYSTQTQLVKRLKRFCQRPSLAKTDKFKVLVEKFSWHNLQKEYRELFLE